MPEPGFFKGEALPADLAALLEVQGEAVSRLVGDDPFVLVGHSAGVVVAHAVAQHMQALGKPAAGVVVIDTYHFTDQGLLINCGPA